MKPNLITKRSYPQGHKQKVTSQTKNSIIEILVIITFIAIFILSIIYRENLKSLISKEILIYGLIMIFLISFLLDFIPQYITPHLLLIEAKILGFPIILTFCLIIAGAILGSLVGFEVGKKYGIKILRKLHQDLNYKKLQKRIRRYGKWIIALAAVSPIPYVPVIFGSLGIKRKTFIYYGILIRLLGLIVFALIVDFF